MMLRFLTAFTLTGIASSRTGSTVKATVLLAGQRPVERPEQDRQSCHNNSYHKHCFQHDRLLFTGRAYNPVPGTCPDRVEEMKIVPLQGL